MQCHLRDLVFAGGITSLAGPGYPQDKCRISEAVRFDHKGNSFLAVRLQSDTALQMSRNPGSKGGDIAQATDFIDSKQDGHESAIAQADECFRRTEAACPCDCQSNCKKSERFMCLMTVFPALDMKTDAALRRALETKTEHTTVIIVAQRISTILHAEPEWYSTMEILSEKARTRNKCPTIAQLLTDCQEPAVCQRTGTFLRR